MIDTTLLNENQKEAVLSDDQYLRIIAGAGSGKTRVLTMRIVHLIEDEDVRPYKILAITFTNKAAKEMKERLSTMLHEDDEPRWISTIHSLCVRILREDISCLGYPKNFTIMDADDQKAIVKEAMKQLDLKDSKLTPGEVVGYISNNKTAQIGVEAAKKMAGSFTDDTDKARIYEYYVNRLKEMYALDFDDLILKTVTLFSDFPSVLEKWQRRFEYVLVDEFQDIDNLQYQLIRFLVGKNASLYVVGDPDQTIYTWRGANVDIIMHFEKDFPNAKTIMLNENYRSTDAILRVSNSVIQNNKNRLKKELYTSKKNEDKVIHFGAESEEYEDAWIAGMIQKLHTQGKKYSDIAILYRSNYLSRGLEKAMIDLRIPYIIYGGIRFYERMEVKDALCYLRMIVTADDLALQRILNRPKRGIGGKTMDNIVEEARRNNSTMYEVLKANQIFSGKAKKTIEEFVSMIEGWKAIEREGKMPLDELLEKIVEESGVKAMCEADEEKKDERLLNLKALQEDLQNFSEDNPDLSLDEYLQNIALYTDRDSGEVNECVQLMTVHAAKGLEFDTVFVTDLNEGIFPNARSIEDSSHGMEEERRLAYVAITRAKVRLFMIHTRERLLYGRTQYNPPSRFIKEIDERYKEDSRAQKQAYEQPTYQAKRKPQISAELFSKPSAIGNVGKTKQTDVFSVGARVAHAVFGEGTVLSVREMGADTLYEIAFDRVGTKKLMATYAKLRKI